MNTRTSILKSVGVIAFLIITLSCSDDGYLPNPNELLKKVKQDGYVIEEISYNKNNLVDEVNSTVFYRKFHYDQDLKLTKEEVAISPSIYSSMIYPGSTHEFVDPHKTGITMYKLYEYDSNGRLSAQYNFIPKEGDDEFRSKRTFEYNADNLISRILLYNSDNEVTQFTSYLYDAGGNVIEEDYYSYLFIPPGTGPKHISKTTFEYDSFYNPYSIFKRSGNPGIFSNTNNIIKSKTTNYESNPGIPAVSESTFAYEYNYITGYPTRVIGGEEFIYD